MQPVVTTGFMPCQILKNNLAATKKTKKQNTKSLVITVILQSTFINILLILKMSSLGFNIK